jgi:hypothetical protein
MLPSFDYLEGRLDLYFNRLISRVYSDLAGKLIVFLVLQAYLNIQYFG